MRLYYFMGEYNISLCMIMLIFILFNTIAYRQYVDAGIQGTNICVYIQLP